MSSRVTDAVDRFLAGHACSQAVLSAYGEAAGLDRPSAMRLSAGFAGGMRLGEVCGAVTAAFMVLGLRHTQNHGATLEDRYDVYGRVIDFAEQFRHRNGSVLCRDLLGCDISTPEGMQQARRDGLFKTTCAKMVRDACELLEEMERADGADG